MGERALPTFKVLLYDGSSGPPSPQLVTAQDDAAAEEIADNLLTRSPTAVGVEVWRDEQRTYARGAAPARKSE